MPRVGRRRVCTGSETFAAGHCVGKYVGHCVAHCEDHCEDHCVGHCASHCASHCVGHCVGHCVSHCVGHCTETHAGADVKNTRRPHTMTCASQSHPPQTRRAAAVRGVSHLTIRPPLHGCFTDRHSTTSMAVVNKLVVRIPFYSAIPRVAVYCPLPRLPFYEGSFGVPRQFLPYSTRPLVYRSTRAALVCPGSSFHTALASPRQFLPYSTHPLV